MSSEKHPLAGYWLVRGAKRDAQCDPFRSVMDLESLEDAIRVGADKNKVTENFAEYLEHRAVVEDWVRGEANAKGVSISNPNPVYFTLQEKPFLAPPPDGSLQINIPADQIPMDDISITYADSFDNYAKKIGKPSEWTPASTKCEIFTAEEVAKMLNTEGIPKDLQEFKNSSYLEVQLWNRDLPALDNAKAQIKKSNSNVITVQPNKNLSQALEQFLDPEWQPEIPASKVPTPEEKAEIIARYCAQGGGINSEQIR